MYKKLLLTILAITFTATSAKAYYDSNRVIRVGISNSSFSQYYHQSFTLYSKSGLELYEKPSFKKLVKISPNEQLQVNFKNNLLELTSSGTPLSEPTSTPLIIKSEQEICTTTITRKGNPACYSGSIEILPSTKYQNRFSIINILPVETYLRGVVPNEMPVRFGLEALKAQSIAARNYALRPRATSYNEFDICDSQACQVYFGSATQNKLSDEAIAKTKGVVALYGNELILALYSSTAGGYTENYEHAFNKAGTKIFPANPLPYLTGTPDNPKTPKLDNEDAAREFYLTYPDTYDNNSPMFRWQRQWSGAEIEETLRKNLPSLAQSGFIYGTKASDLDFGTLKDIKVLSRGVSGKIIDLEIIGTKNNIYVQKELVVRRLFKKNKQQLPSANMVFDIEHNEDGSLKNLSAYGGGFGHGVGMSQFGAGAMAQKGFDFAQILKRYYKNISLATEPITLYTNYDENTALSSFYVNSSHAHLVIERKPEFLTLTINVNGAEEKLNLTPSLSKTLSYDISKYLIKGENRVTYYLEPENNRKKSTKIHIEFLEISQ